MDAASSGQIVRPHREVGPAERAARRRLSLGLSALALATMLAAEPALAQRAPAPPSRPDEFGRDVKPRSPQRLDTTRGTRSTRPARPPGARQVPAPQPPGPAQPPAPEVAGPPAPEVAGPPAPPVATLPAAASPVPGVCLASLAGLGLMAEAAAQPTPDKPDCQIEEPVRLLSASNPHERGGGVALSDRPVVACRFAALFGPFLARVAAPVLKAGRGATLTAVQTGPGHECRPRNRQPGAKPSAHGQGLALDISGFAFADRTTMSIEEEGKKAVPDPDLAAVRTAACGWFTTVLGPGADAFHTDHIHLDIIRHGSSDRYKICQ